MTPRLILITSITLACQSRTELVLGVATDLKAKEQLDEVDILVVEANNPSHQIGGEEFDLSAMAGVPDNLPGSIGIYSDGNADQLDILLTGKLAGSAIVTRHAIMSLVPNQTLFYRMGLTAACQTVTDCGSDEDCIEGACAEKFVNAGQFPGFDGTLVDTLTCNSGTTYINTAMGNTPMPLSSDAADCGSGLCHEGTCLNPPPACSASNAEQACQPALNACTQACGQCDFDGGDCSEVEQLDLNSQCLAALCALFACATSVEADWGSGSDGECEPQGCLDENSSTATAACDGSDQASTMARRLISRIAGSAALR